jgi:tetratricopeptide (TPR) repeat protein
MTLEQTLQAAITHHKSGDLVDAEKLYRSILTEQTNHPDANHNLGVLLKQDDKADIALPFFKTALESNPNQAQFWVSYIDTLIQLQQYEAAQNVLNQGQAKGLKGGAVDQLKKRLNLYPEVTSKKNLSDPPQAQIDAVMSLYSQGQIQEALSTSEMLIKDYPNTPLPYNISGACYNALGQLDAAVKSYKQALAINPDYADTHYNLGNTLEELGQLEEAVKRYEQALVIKPGYAEAHCNLGNTLKDLGQLKAAVKHYEKALAIKPDLVEAWGNVFFTAKALDLSTTQNAWLTLYKKNLDAAVLNNIHFKILEYKLNAVIPHSVDGFFDNAINALPLKTSEEIQNPSPTHQNEDLSSLPNNMTALIHFGRSGTGLLHSLIDNHPEISTLPSIYFSEYYNEDVWGKLIAQGWGQLPKNFIKQFAVLFDARSSVPIPSIDKPIANLGQKEGMANVGVNRNEVLTVDQNRFCAELKALMRGYATLTPQSFFTLVHNAYEKALNNASNKQTIFYHIHNPSAYAKLNFLRYNPEAKLLMIVREPIQSCESWLKKFIKESSGSMHNRIVTMLFDIDQIAFRRQDSIGVRLEDLKTQPEATLAALCDWMGIEESSTLYEMTAQGKKWWGDPSSPDYSPKGMSPFDDSAITRKVGSIFSEQDQFILRTLFYPFSVRFGYVEENLEGFKENLKAIKPLLDEPFGFQKKLAENLNKDLETITRSGPALFMRAALHNRWEVLNEFNDYPHMLKPLTISVKK